MSDFDKAIPTIFDHEGKFANNPSDPGGPTNFGISLRFYHTIAGCEHATETDIKSLTKDAAAKIYKQYFWDKYHYGQIADQNIATKILDLCVNMGPSPTHILVQRAIRAAINIKLEEDGVMGVKTITAINMCKPNSLMPAIKAEAANYYRSIRFDGASKFIMGWLARAYSDPLKEE